MTSLLTTHSKTWVIIIRKPVKNSRDQRKTFLYSSVIMKRKDQDLTLESSSKVGLVSGARLTSSSAQADAQLYRGLCLREAQIQSNHNGPNITLGIWTEGQVEQDR